MTSLIKLKYQVSQNYPILLIVILIALVYLSFFISPVSLGGDFNFVSFDYYRIVSQKPYIWDIGLGNGFGQYVLFTLPFFWYASIFNKLTQFISNPFLLHKIIYLYPLLIIGFLSSFSLSRQITKNKIARATLISVYLLNPYIIMLASGGQIGVALAYALAPILLSHTLFLTRNIDSIKDRSKLLKHGLISGLLLSLGVTFDSRLTLIISVVNFSIITSFLSTTTKNKSKFFKFGMLYTLAFAVVLLIHSFWLLPSIFVHNVSLPAGYGESANVKFFSFARLAHAFAWMHPNYPDNKFGVVKEISWFTLFIPLLAFWNLKQQRKLTTFFSLVALISIFLIKGANEPFGQLYLWLFDHIPLFNWYRDSTKFFLPLSLSYSILIALTIEHITHTKSNRNKLILVVISAIFVLAWYPTFSHQIKGTLAYRTYPAEFQELQTILNQDKSFGRVLWLPQRELYGLSDITHPAVNLTELKSSSSCLPIFCEPQKIKSDTQDKNFSLQDLYSEIDTQTNFLTDPYTETIFKELAINYVILTPDHDKEIYVYDRKYNENVKKYYESKLKNIMWLEPVKTKNSLVLYKTHSTGSLVMSRSSISTEIQPYEMIDPVTYKVTLKNTTEPLIFSQTFSDRWVLTQDNKEINSQSNHFGMNEFPLEKLKPGEATIEYKGQISADIGIIISGIALLLSLAAVTILHLKESNEATR